jgi:hypothetical protein
VLGTGGIVKFDEGSIPRIVAPCVAASIVIVFREEFFQINFWSRYPPASTVSPEGRRAFSAAKKDVIE